MFVCTPCSSIYAFDTGDMLVTRPFLHTLPAYFTRSSQAKPQANDTTGDRCLISKGFNAPPLCYNVASRARVEYFNAGTFAIATSCIGRHVFAKLMELTIVPPVPSVLSPKSWATDQDVLNLYFDKPHFRQLSSSLNVNKRALLEASIVYGSRIASRMQAGYRTLMSHVHVHGLAPVKPHAFSRAGSRKSCIANWRVKAQGEPVIIHYLGKTKPWMSRAEKLLVESRSPKLKGRRLETHRTILDIMDPLWWAEFLNDKTVVVGAGPSLKAPFGKYIDFCHNVIRLNDFVLSEKTHGLHVTHAVVHKATQNRPPSSHVIRRLPPDRVLLAGFGEPASVLDARMGQKTGIRVQLSRNELTLLPDYYHIDLNTELGLPPKRHALTGTIAVAWALRNTEVRPIFVIGLDLAWETNISNYQHADHSSTSLESLLIYHQIEADARWLRGLEARGEIRRLNVALSG